MLDKEVKVVTNGIVSNPALKKFGSDTIAFASGTLGIRKVLLTSKTMGDVSFMPIRVSNVKPRKRTRVIGDELKQTSPCGGNIMGSCTSIGYASAYYNCETQPQAAKDS